MIAIENCRIVPIDRPVIERGAILIDGSRIRAIHDLRAERRLEKAQTGVDGTGLTAIPGMGQMHGHFSSYLHTMDTAPVNAQPDTLKAIQAVAQYLKQHSAVLTVFYTSNVEQYLFQDDGNWRRFYENAGVLPLDSTSTFIRYVLNSGGFNRRSRTLLSPITDMVSAYKNGRIHSYYDVVDWSQ